MSSIYYLQNNQLQNEIFEDHLNFIGNENFSSIIDLGCGPGNTSVILNKHFNCHVLGVDLDSERIEHANTHHNTQNINFSEKDISDIPLETLFSHDLIFANLSLHWLENNQFFHWIKELKKNGNGKSKLSFTIPIDNTYSSFKDLLTPMNISIMKFHQTETLLQLLDQENLNYRYIHRNYPQKFSNLLEAVKYFSRMKTSSFRQKDNIPQKISKSQYENFKNSGPIFLNFHCFFCIFEL